jgi:exoribonuclease R
MPCNQQYIVDDTLQTDKRDALGNYDDARQSLLLLIRMARHLKSKRLERGALTLESVEVKFEMDQIDNNVPKNISMLTEPYDTYTCRWVALTQRMLL